MVPAAMKTTLALLLAIAGIATAQLPESAYPPEWQALVVRYNTGGEGYTLERWEADMRRMLLQKYPNRADLFQELEKQVQAERTAKLIRDVRIAQEIIRRDRRAYDPELAEEKRRSREFQWAVEDAVDAAIRRHHNRGYRFR